MFIRKQLLIQTWAIQLYNFKISTVITLGHFYVVALQLSHMGIAYEFIATQQITQLHRNVHTKQSHAAESLTSMIFSAIQLSIFIVEDADRRLNAPSLYESNKVNPSPPRAGYMRQSIWRALVQVMACRLFGTKPLPEPVLAYCQLDNWEQMSAKFQPCTQSKIIFIQENLKLSSAEMAAILSGGDELTLCLNTVSTSFLFSK